MESCTPDQLYRLEKYSRVLAAETGQLWKMHCQHNFKKQRRKEDESWQETYLQLQNAQEQRLRAPILKIRSARANDSARADKQRGSLSTSLKEGLQLSRKKSRSCQPYYTPQQAAMLPLTSLGGQLLTAQAPPVPTWRQWAAAAAGSLQSRLPQ